MFSNKYIFVYTGVLVVAVAVILALAATLLQPMQQRNSDAAKMQEILKAAGRIVEREEAVELYPAVIAGEMLVDPDGRVVENTMGCAFKANMKAELAKGDEARFPVFATQDSLYIVPLYGRGLWGPIWGYLALEKDLNTVYGVSFGHQGETPGLGAEIVSDKFQNNFKGKKIFEPDGGFIGITAQKGGADKYPGDISHAVDAVSGGTITSKGVTAMLFDCLKGYVPFFTACAPVPTDDGATEEEQAEETAATVEPVPAPEPEPEPAPLQVIRRYKKPAPVEPPVEAEQPQPEEAAPAAVEEQTPAEESSAAAPKCKPKKRIERNKL